MYPKSLWRTKYTYTYGMVLESRKVYSFSSLCVLLGFLLYAYAKDYLNSIIENQR